MHNLLQDKRWAHRFRDDSREALLSFHRKIKMADDENDSKKPLLGVRVWMQTDTDDHWVLAKVENQWGGKVFLDRKTTVWHEMGLIVEDA